MEDCKNEGILNQIKSKCIFNKLRNDYFLQKTFNNLQKKKSLEIVKYNNNNKQRLNLNINDYKKYCETYSSIEIEIIPNDNYCDIFINIKDEDKIYYHIYFNDKKEEVEIYYLGKNNNISKINIIIDYQVQSFKYLFFDGHCISSIYFKKFSRNNITDMSWMFGWCSSLKELNLTNFNTDNVTDMNHMLFKCSSLEKVTIPNFNSTKVTNMSSMFQECYLLKDLDLYNFDTNNVTDMRYMFNGCSKELKNKIKSEYKNIKEEAFL